MAVYNYQTPKFEYFRFFQTMQRILTLVFITVFLSSLSANGQNKEKPELKPTDLEKHTYYFDIVDGKFTGKGADFLKKEIQNTQYFLLGEYHNSLRVSEFTKSLIPVLHNQGYRYFGLEIGPISNIILNELSKDPNSTVSSLRKFNSKYYVKSSRRTFTPIPFFSNVGDAEFLVEARGRKWNIIGLDQEFSYGYLSLLDRMYANLRKKQKRRLKTAHMKAVAVVTNAYSVRFAGGKAHYQAINDSKEYNDFLDAASINNPRNRAIANALRKTTDIYLKNVTRRYFAANSTRINYMKENLRRGFDETKFDLKRDKMLLKMGSVHTSKGFGNLSLYEVGNTLHELAKFNGNRSLHAYFYSRYYVENGKVIDPLADKTSFTYRFKALLQMAKKDQWTIIDLRPLRSNVFYSRRYKLDEIVLSIFKQHDIVIIPKIEKDAASNFDLGK